MNPRPVVLAALLSLLSFLTAFADPLPWCTGAVSEGRWILKPDGLARRGHSLVFDAARDRLIVFGGSASNGQGTGGLPVYNQVWVRPTSLATPWEPLATTGTPAPARMLHVAVFDPVDDRMIVYGGWGPGGGFLGYFGDAWQLDFSVDPPRWSEIPVSGVRARGNATAVYDAGGRRMLVYGGYAVAPGSGLQDYTNEIWELALDGPPTWTRRATHGAGMRRAEGVRSTYDASRNRWIVSGGLGRIRTGFADPDWFNDVTAIDLATMEATALAAADRDSFSHYEHSLTWDPAHDRLLLFGGAQDFPEGVSALSLAGTGAAWRTLAASGIAAATRVDHAAWFDERRNRLVIVGGGGVPGGPASGTSVLSFGRPVRAALDPASNAAFHARVHRTITIVLYGSDALPVTELEPSTIRIGQAPIVAEGGGRWAFDLWDVDGDARLDASVDVDAFAIAGGVVSPSVNVSGQTKFGDPVCGTLELDGALTPGRMTEDPGLGTEGAKTPAKTTDAIALHALLGEASRSRIQLRVRIPSPGAYALELWSVQGRRVASTSLEGPIDQVVAIRPASRLAPGIYWARLSGAAPGPTLRVVLAGD